MLSKEGNRMKQISGNLLDLAEAGQFDLIVHGCNCFCTMGAGLAKTIRQHYPEAFAADAATVAADRNKLGTYSIATIRRGPVEFLIVNAYTQYDWRGRHIKADYDAIRSVFARLRQTFPDKRIGYPLIGAGLARGDWKLISSIIEAELAGMDHALVVLPNQEPPTKFCAISLTRPIHHGK
ncbi:macro domain-containing protein [Chitinimonas lacunae]|uniref:Macro domain-containing protein n=1 Tax=Chitinimonas lacunae TaxID=1963018 RepID=A0ABV8MP85_9NEIS